MICLTGHGSLTGGNSLRSLASRGRIDRAFIAKVSGGGAGGGLSGTHVTVILCSVWFL